jgi:hypothetical protein
MLSNKFAVIIANAGSGKSMLMRHLFLDTIKKTDQVPILIELRDINNYDLTLFELIKKKLIDNKFDLDDEYIEKAFKAGHFAILLDGFDEIVHDKREETIQSIQELADKFEQNYFVLSSRPDDSLYRWTLFNVWRVQPLSVDLACLLIEKTAEDKELKSKFIKELHDELFETHESFLSNPLLLSIMLITYKDSANIPQKLSTFYGRAYIALFERHDAQKGALNRDKRSGLDIQEFKKVFASFCFLTFGKRKFSFSDTEIFEYLDKTQLLSGIPFSKKEFLEDSIQAVCLLVRDGLEITFSHRSFQEYFMAMYVSQISDTRKQEGFVSKYFAEVRMDDIQTLLLEIAPECVERYFIIPALQELEIAIGYVGDVGNEQYQLFLKSLYKKVSVEPQDSDTPGLVLYIANTRLSRAYSVVERYYLKPPRDRSKDFDSDNLFSMRISALSDDNDGPWPEVTVSKVISDAEAFQLISTGTHRLSRSTLERVLKVKDSLIEKHTQQDAFLDQELLE